MVNAAQTKQCTTPSEMFVIVSTLAACKSTIKITGIKSVGDIKFTMEADCPGSVDCIGVNETIANKMSDNAKDGAAKIISGMKSILSGAAALAGLDIDIKASAKIATCAGGPTAETCKVVCKTDCKERKDDNKINVKIDLKVGSTTVRSDFPVNYAIAYACPKGKAMYKMGLAWWAILLIVLAVVIVVAAIVVICVCACKKGKHGNVSTQKGHVMTTVK